MFTLGQLADQLGLTVSGDPDKTIAGLAPLSDATPSDLSFYSDARHRDALACTRAAAVILRPDDEIQCPVDCLLAEDPYLAFARASALFDPSPERLPGVHASAVVADTVIIGAGVHVGPGAVVEDQVELGEGAVIGAGCFVGRGARIGAGSVLHPQVVVCHGVVLGRDCTIHSQAVLGSDGFGFARGESGWEKIRQLGGLVLGDVVEIGAGTTVDRGTLADTVIEDGVIIDNQVQIAHNCRIGKNTAIAACCGVAGGATIGADCTLAGGVGVVGHVRLCDQVHVTGMTMVTRSIDRPGSYSSGTRMAPTAEWRRNAVRLSQVDTLLQRLAELERRLEDNGE